SSTRKRNPAHWEGDQYLLETEKCSDPTGRGWKFTDAAAEAQRRKWERLMANRPPAKLIAPELLASSGTNPPVLYYGWPFKKNYMVDYAKRHHMSFDVPKHSRAILNCCDTGKFNFKDITDDDYRNEDVMIGLRVVASQLVVRDLIRKTAVPLAIDRPFSLHWDFMLVLWTNYNAEQHYEPLDAFGTYDTVVKILTCAMNDDPAGERSKLRWWWGWGNGAVSIL
ncbi:hypothetical protein C8Q76DRAFT_592070, partial [Earliella scabrosa]